MRSDRPGSYVDSYLEDAVRGERRPAIQITLELLEQGVPEEQVVVDLLAAAQREVGERWYRNELTIADEHIATGVSAAALDALASEATPTTATGHTVVACAEGDWHSLAAQMFGEALRTRGIGVTILGASTPADAVADFLSRGIADSLAISCSLPTFFPGVTRVIDAAHRHRVPVIVGGRAFGVDDRRARRLGADGWALDAGEAANLLRSWQIAPPAFDRTPRPLDPLALRLAAEAADLSRRVMDRLASDAPGQVDDLSLHRAARTREDLEFILEFLAAAVLVDDDVIFTEFLDWMDDLPGDPAGPPHPLDAELEMLVPIVGSFSDRFAQLLDRGRRYIQEAQAAGG